VEKVVRDVQVHVAGSQTYTRRSCIETVFHQLFDNRTQINYDLTGLYLVHLGVPQKLAMYLAPNIIGFSYRPALYGFYGGHGMIAEELLLFGRRDAILKVVSRQASPLFGNNSTLISVRSSFIKSDKGINEPSRFSISKCSAWMRLGEFRFGFPLLTLQCEISSYDWLKNPIRHILEGMPN
jgi:hypothetical protein